MRIPALLAALMLATPTMATDLPTYSGSEFEARVSGLTIFFERQGQAFGAEQYFPDKRVIWAFENGECNRGIWFENTSGDICFVYDSSPEPVCWQFFKQPGGGLSARAEGADPFNDLLAVEETTEPLECPLPDMGV